MKILDCIALVLLLIGGLNWGLVAVADMDLVATLFGVGSMLSKIIYGLIGLAAIEQIVQMVRFGCCPTCSKE